MEKWRGGIEDGMDNSSALIQLRMMVKEQILNASLAEIDPTEAVNLGFSWVIVSYRVSHSIRNKIRRNASLNSRNLSSVQEKQAILLDAQMGNYVPLRDFLTERSLSIPDDPFSIKLAQISGRIPDSGQPLEIPSFAEQQS